MIRSIFRRKEFYEKDLVQRTSISDKNRAREEKKAVERLEKERKKVERERVREEKKREKELEKLEKKGKKTKATSSSKSKVQDDEEDRIWDSDSDEVGQKELRGSKSKAQTVRPVPAARKTNGTNQIIDLT